MPPTRVSELSRNRVLATVHPTELERFTDVLSLREFKSGEVVSEPRERITHVVFPVDAVFSVVAETADGDQIEAGTIGHDGVVGLAPFLGGESTLLRSMCQVPGTAYVAEVGQLLARADGAMATAARRYALSFMTMASQGAACNRLHPIEQRAARWLLMVHDRIDRNPFELTHEFLGIMLGANRPSVTLAAGKLRALGAIDYRRGRVTIVDRSLLEEAACACYEVITSEFERSMRTTLRKKQDGRAPARQG
jgi:CRP-like cAMP-binding protein